MSRLVTVFFCYAVDKQSPIRETAVAFVFFPPSEREVVRLTILVIVYYLIACFSNKIDLNSEEIANHVSLSTISDSKIMTDLITLL